MVGVAAVNVHRAWPTEGVAPTLKSAHEILSEVGALHVVRHKFKPKCEALSHTQTSAALKSQIFLKRCSGEAFVFLHELFDLGAGGRSISSARIDQRVAGDGL